VGRGLLPDRVALPSRGGLRRCPATAMLVPQLVGAGARLDSRAIQDLIAHTSGMEVLLDVLAELLVTFAELDRDRSPW
jgi:hypothetical protein